MDKAIAPDTGSASNNSPLSFEESVENLSHLIPDSDANLGDDEGTEAEADDEGNMPDAEGEEAEADEKTEDEENPDGSGDYSKGRFASDDAKVTLKDGSVVTVTELKRGFLSNQAFTRNSTDLARERETFTQQRQKVETFAQQIMQEREFFLQAAQQLLPQPPDESLISSEPLEYMAQKAAYERSLGLFQQLQYQHQTGLTRKQEEELGKRNESRAAEARKMFEAMPELKAPGAYQKFWGEAVETMADYGFTEAELNEVSDHRMYKAMRDLARLRRAVKKAPKVAEQVQGKPKLIGGGKRMDPKGKEVRNKQGLAERQRASGGSLEATVARLESLI